MATVALDHETYRRIEKLANESGVSIQEAAVDAVNNWIDLTSGSLLAITARTAKAKSQPA